MGKTVKGGGFGLRRAAPTGATALAVALVASLCCAGTTASAAPPPANPDPPGTIYVADLPANSIDVFAPGATGNVAPLRRIIGPSTGLNGPDDIKVDALGDLFVPNYFSNSVLEYGPGASGDAAPIRRIQGPHTGLNIPDDLSVGADGTIYVGNIPQGANHGSVVVFGPGAAGDASPLRTIAGPNTGFGSSVDGVGADASGTLYAADTFNKALRIFAPGANGNVAPQASITGLDGYPGDVVVGFSGQVYTSLSNDPGAPQKVLVFSAGSSGNATPAQDIEGSNTQLVGSDDMAVRYDGAIGVANSLGSSVTIYAPGASGNVAPKQDIQGSATTLIGPEGIAFALPSSGLTVTTGATAAGSLGQPSHDTATLAGGTGETGSLVFNLFGPNDPTCNAAPAYTSPAEAVTGNANYVSPSFTPTATGAYSWVAEYSGDFNNPPITTACGDPNESFTTSSEQPISAAGGKSLTGTEGTAMGGTLATFTDPDTAATASQYAATIDWGDGGPTSAGSVSGSGSSFTVSGSHVYADEGSDTIVVKITDVDDATNSATATDSATIADAAVTVAGTAPATSPQTFNGTVAAVTDANASTSTASDLTATIDWGDGSVASTGTVSGSGGSYAVSGIHTYTSTGYVTIKVHVVDDGGSSADASSTVLVFGTARGGSFVIGDRNARTGTAITFWGAQWSKVNSMSGGPGPSSFKGFEDSPAAAACGTRWTTDPGNSTPPPAGPLPAYLAVIVSSTVNQTGSSISGDTVHEVVVRTDAGYAAAPGHPGAGTVVATIC